MDFVFVICIIQLVIMYHTYKYNIGNNSIILNVISQWPSHVPTYRIIIIWTHSIVSFYSNESEREYYYINIPLLPICRLQHIIIIYNTIIRCLHRFGVKIQQVPVYKHIVIIFATYIDSAKRDSWRIIPNMFQQHHKSRYTLTI